MSDRADFLAFVAHGLGEANNFVQRHTATINEIVKRQAAVLDSLAYLMVSEQNQVVAVGVQLVEENRSGITIFVAENRTSLPELKLHQSFMWKRSLLACSKSTYGARPALQKSNHKSHIIPPTHSRPRL
ncbi:hypothetical protein B0H19DRAFT_1107728 [Mycena capillaripes]|nr:hypothetical protein B0H19DRAFT_1107728 [Mycena capillaripes]